MSAEPNLSPAREDREVLIRARGIEKSFPVRGGWFSRGKSVRAVDGVDLELRANETLALVGESGSGKSTLGNIVLGLLPPTSGTVEWEGRPVASLGQADRLRFRRDVQVVFQNPYSSLNPRMTVGSILRRPLALHADDSGMDLDREARRLLEVVGLVPAAGFIERYPHELSGGQRQRVAIARALAPRPRIIVADEPVSALDVSVRAQVLNLLRSLKREFGLAMLFTTHDLGVVRFMADRVAVMYLGKIVEVASRERFFAMPRHPYSRVLLASALSPNPAAGRAFQHLDIRGEPPSPTDPPSGCRFRTRCAMAIDRCSIEAPLLRDPDAATTASSSTGEHLVACHLPLGPVPADQR
jgi:oligopeptide/dipeptide ABC transporter ATP-binding protein